MRDPSRIRECLVAWNKVIAEVLLDLEILQDRTLGHTVDEHHRQMDMADQIIRLKGLRPNFHSTHHDVTVFAGLVLCRYAGKESVEVFLRWYVESSVPFASDGVKWNKGLHA